MPVPVPLQGDLRALHPGDAGRHLSAKLTGLGKLTAISKDWMFSKQAAWMVTTSGSQIRLEQKMASVPREVEWSSHNPKGIDCFLMRAPAFQTSLCSVVWVWSYAFLNTAEARG